MSKTKCQKSNANLKKDKVNQSLVGYWKGEKKLPNNTEYSWITDFQSDKNFIRRYKYKVKSGFGQSADFGVWRLKNGNCCALKFVNDMNLPKDSHPSPEQRGHSFSYTYIITSLSSEEYTYCVYETGETIKMKKVQDSMAL
ncbi:hypothetical protein [Spartinivicinus poritis]|uniref:Uncharacterized protein n=1 Tax=Spartinivicinus poritis TaxID=2994640 RepID=A0ABT5UEH1_9GAMM|nr:hypothetical protein [Spartinivicinus sp. A2-2]MDE1464778.1 hypothetical protein [Spartinivicinus sp. A2-2]